jgi:hypothetical protein
MKPVRTTILTILSAILPMAVTGVRATAMDTVSLSTPAFYPGLGGGEFSADFSSAAVQNAAVALYNPGAVVAGGVETFCVETGVDFNANQAYTYTFGGIAQATPGTAPVGAGLPVSQGAAWLYDQFAAAGQRLAGFDYTGPARGNDDNLLQAAIWMLQGGQTYGGYPVPTADKNVFYSAALAQFGGLAGAESPYTGNAVGLLQLWDDAGDAAQNQLVLMPAAEGDSVPDGGLAAGLLGVGLFGLFLVESGLGKFSR